MSESSSPVRGGGSRGDDPAVRVVSPSSIPPPDDLVAACVDSSLWAAWGDALGFISELTGFAGLARRLHRKRPLSLREGATEFEQLCALLEFPPHEWPLQSTVGWTRRVGGRSGVDLYLPPGAYSDDTQLRLATSRCTEEGAFAVEQFASIELPAFTSYALGGGNATKAGAAAMAKPNSSWAAPGHDSWASAGGNGVVMRVSPLAYSAAAHGTSTEDLVLTVIRNGVVTHGHPRALLPACLHAVALVETMRHQQLAPIDVLHRWLETLRDVPDLMRRDPALGRATVPAFEGRLATSLDVEWSKTVDEMHVLIERFSDASSRTNSQADVVQAYLRVGRDVGLFAPASRGVGTACFVAAYWLADVFRYEPKTGVRLAANAVGSDTDTIATIAGAHLGVVHPAPGDEALLDRDYIEAETLRVVRASHGRAAPSMTYPELDQWRAPRAQADYVGIDPSSGRIALAGLGGGEWVSRPVHGPRNSEFVWQWFGTDYGQTVPVKRRIDLVALAPSQLPRVSTRGQAGMPTVPPSEELDELRARFTRANTTARKKTRSDRPIASDGPATPNERLRERSEGGETDQEPIRGRVDQGDPWLDGVSEDVTGNSGVGLTLESAIRHAEQFGFADEAVGRMTRLLAQRVSPDAALAFAGYAMRVWLQGRGK